MIKKFDKNVIRKKRHYRIRKNITGTQEKPRFNVYRSANHIYVQVIDDVSAKTICSASTTEKDIAAATSDMTRQDAAYYVGEQAAKRAMDKGVKLAAFDRGGYLYTGRIQKVAEGARAAGLKF